MFLDGSLPFPGSMRPNVHGWPEGRGDGAGAGYVAGVEEVVCAERRRLQMDVVGGEGIVCADVSECRQAGQVWRGKVQGRGQGRGVGQGERWGTLGEVWRSHGTKHIHCRDVGHFGQVVGHGVGHVRECGRTYSIACSIPIANRECGVWVRAHRESRGRWGKALPFTHNLGLGCVCMRGVANCVSSEVSIHICFLLW